MKIMLLLSEGRIFDGHNAREMRWMAWFGMAQVRRERRRHGEKRIRQFKRHLRSPHASVSCFGARFTQYGTEYRSGSQFIGRPQTFVELQLCFKLHFYTAFLH